VSLFDINRREFVVVRQAGGPRSALCKRQPERAHTASTVMRKRQAVVISDPEGIARAVDDRFNAIGIELKSLVCAPVELGGRYLGLIELANPLDGGVFNEGDGHALTYIGQQFAEFVAARGITLDPDLIRERAQAATHLKWGR
jgi:GAF domain-containing protein